MRMDHGGVTQTRAEVSPGTMLGKFSLGKGLVDAIYRLKILSGTMGLGYPVC
jgi:hypothetical protein